MQDRSQEKLLCRRYDAYLPRMWWKKIKQNGLSKKYQTEKEMLFFSKLLNLPFVLSVKIIFFKD